ncbi:MAG TPA: hypothetical protein VIK25_03625 [Gemmatimonadaceae bacterium]
MTLLCLVNVLGVKLAAQFQGVMVVVLAGAILYYGAQGPMHFDPSRFEGMWGASTGNLFLGTALLSFTYMGSNGIIELGGTGSYTLTASASGYASVVFTATVNTVPMSVTAAEKQPNGTQQFSVTGGNQGDTYNWSVNNIAGGNSTFGTIRSSGFYTAPATVPTPATFAVCAQSVQTPANKGCINVTIRVTPSAGGELIVMNDVNWGDIGLYRCGTVYCYPSNEQFVKNLVNFTAPGVRSSASKVMFFDEYGMQPLASGWPEVGNIITGQGYTTIQTNLHSDLNSIPADVKVVVLVMPGTSFAVSEINGLKTFASQGGRILFIGENGGYYAYGLPIENAFLTSIGALMTNTGSCDAQGVIVNSVAHQLTAGIAASGTGGFYMNCVSRINLGPNDFALMTTTNLDYYVPLPVGQSVAVMAAIAKIDLTLLPLPLIQQGGLRSMTEQGVGVKTKPMGLPGWTSTGPPPP